MGVRPSVLQEAVMRKMRSARQIRLAAGAAVASLGLAAGAHAQVTLGGFTGGEAGEGLDLDGDFVHAVNVRGPGAGQVRDAVFTDEATAGVSVIAGNEIINWHAPNYGATPE